MLRAVELRAMSEEELRKKEEEIKKELLAMRFQKALGRLDSPALYQNLRKDLARVKTVLRERELSEALEGKDGS